MKTTYPDVGEVAEPGARLYEKSLRQILEPAQNGKFAVINVGSGAFELDEDRLNAARRAKARWPGAPLYLVRIGFESAGRIGGRLSARSQ